MGFSPLHWLIVLAPLIAVAWVAVVLARRPGGRGDLIAPPPRSPVVTPASVDTDARADGSVETADPAVTLPDDVMTKVWAELRFGRQINAIKLVHDSSDLDLRQSKAFVDDMRRRDPDLRGS